MKITIIGAGSTVFTKNILGVCMMTPGLGEGEYCLFDIDEMRLANSKKMIEAMNEQLNNGKATIITTMDAATAIKDADYLVNTIQVGGYKPSTVIDFDIPKKYGLRQTIGDSLGIGGIFRALRTIPVLFDYCRLIEELAPNAWLLNYSNPMAMVTGALLKNTGVKTVGLCHSVQGCARTLVEGLGLPYDEKRYRWKIAGINHMAWLLEIERDGKDVYPELKRLSREKGAPENDRVRHEIMHTFGYYVTESSEHNAEYMPYFIKARYPELIEEYNIPLDLYLKRCEDQIETLDAYYKNLDAHLEKVKKGEEVLHTRSVEYAPLILDALHNGNPIEIHGNVLNKSLITNLPEDACVEVPCLVNKNGIQPTVVGDLPEQLAALNRTNINVQNLTIQAAVTKEKDYIYQAALLDPHTSSELSIRDIKNLVDDLIEAHGDYLPVYH